MIWHTLATFKLYLIIEGSAIISFERLLNKIFILCTVRNTEPRFYLIFWMWWTCHSTAGTYWSIPGQSVGCGSWNPCCPLDQQRSSLTGCSKMHPDYLFKCKQNQCGHERSGLLSAHLHLCFIKLIQERSLHIKQSQTIWAIMRELLKSEMNHVT